MILSYESFIKAPVTDVFAFYNDLNNLQRITPPSYQMNILEIQGNMRAGTRIELEIRKFMHSYYWCVQIIEHIPNRSFTDVQEKGPFTFYQHRHEFKPQAEGTLLRDEINLQLPHYPLTWPIEQWIVKPQLDALFRYRHEKTKRLLQKQVD